jgi:hypothetical protein
MVNNPSLSFEKSTGYKNTPFSKVLTLQARAVSRVSGGQGKNKLQHPLLDSSISKKTNQSEKLNQSRQFPNPGSTP